MTTRPARRELTPIRLAGLALASLALIGGITACGDAEGSGDITTLTMSDVVDPEVTAVTVLSDIDVNVVVDPSQPQSGSLRIDDNLIEEMNIWVDDDGELFVGWSGYSLDVDPSEQPILTVHVQRLDRIANRSHGTVRVDGVDADRFEVESTDDGHIDVTGQAETINVDVAEDGVTDLRRLHSDVVELERTGDGELTISASDRVTGGIDGDGVVRLYGDASTDSLDVDEGSLEREEAS